MFPVPALEVALLTSRALKPLGSLGTRGGGMQWGPGAFSISWEAAHRLHL